jgi:hypothetical protein
MAGEHIGSPLQNQFFWRLAYKKLIHKLVVPQFMIAKFST